MTSLHYLGTGAIHQPIQTCRERIWTGIYHDDAITSARVWTNYLEPFLNQIGGTTSSTGKYDMNPFLFCVLVYHVYTPTPAHHNS